MSYILEALKKAQAERQLGNAPTIHTPPPAYAAPARAGKRMPLLVGLGAGLAVVAAGAVFMMRQPAPVPAPAVQVAAAPVTVPAAAPVAPPVPAQPVLPEPLPPSKPVETVKPKAQPKPEAPVRVAEAPARVDRVEPVPEAPRPAAVAAAPAPPPAPAPAQDDGVGPLQSLPEALQREVPKVTFGGYIYSPNPAERLLLVDKMLRREGEEVAPGLVLERLLPKAAIMNFRGYRYRVGY